MREPDTTRSQEGSSRRETEMQPASSGYAEVNGINLYHEINGEGRRLVLIP